MSQPEKPDDPNDPNDEQIQPEESEGEGPKEPRLLVPPRRSGGVGRLVPLLAVPLLAVGWLGYHFGMLHGLGDTCSSDGDCRSGHCLASLAGQPGSCTDTCTADADCGEGLRCFEEGAEHHCVPPAMFEIGANCARSDQCKSGVCAQPPAGAAAPGFCTQKCGNRGECPDGSRCDAIGAERLCVGLTYYESRVPEALKRRQGCDKGKADDCAALGEMYEEGDGLPADAAAAIALYVKACDAGSAAACVDIGTLLSDGDVIAADFPRAARYFEKGCQAGVQEGCIDLAELLQSGQGIPKDEARARQLFQDACDKGAGGGCNALGVLYSKGLGVPVDEAKGQGFYQKACDAGDNEGCFNLGAQLLAKKEPDGLAKAFKLFERACENKQAESCHNLGMMYALGQGVGQDKAKSLAYLKRACVLGLDSPDCSVLNPTQ